MSVLFDYIVSTSPQPLQASMIDVPANGTINVYVRTPVGTTAYCNQFLVSVDVGTDPGTMFAASPAPTGGVSTTKWLQSSFEVGKKLDAAPATFTYDCQAAADFAIGYNLVFSIQGSASTQTGQPLLSIQENSGTTSDPSTFTPKNTTIPVTVAAPQLYVQNFIATAPGSPGVSCTEFPNNSEIDFSWESNATWFTLSKKGDAAPFWSGSALTNQFAAGVPTDTTFVLVASMSGDPSQNAPGTGFNQISLNDALTITVSNPILAPASVAAAGVVSAGGTLTVTGAAALNGGASMSTATVAGNATVGGTLVVTGQTTTGALTATGALSAQGTVAMIGAGTNLAAGNYQSTTDGYVLGFITWGGNTPSDHCLGWIYGSCNGYSVGATGGNTVYWLDDHADWASCANQQMFVLPVAANQQFSLAVQLPTNPVNDENPQYSFTWCPLGVGTAPALMAKTHRKEHLAGFGDSTATTKRHAGRS